METARRATALLLLALAASLPLGAQEAPSSQPDGARARLEAGARWTSLQSRNTLLLGGSALFDLGTPFRFGGSAWVLADPLELATATSGSGLRLKLAYGGVQTVWALPVVGAARLSGSLLLGAGSAKLELPVVGTEIAADNFLVVEPGVAVAVPLAGALHARGSVDYRHAAGLEDLPGVAADRIRGFSLTFGLAIGPP